MKLNILTQVVVAIFLCAQISKAKRRRDIICNGKQSSKSFLWMIKRRIPAYFFGTIHVPYTRVWNHIPQSTMDAFNQSDQIYFELDLTDTHTLSSLMKCQMLPGGTDLRKVLPGDLYQRLKQHLDYVKNAMPNWITSEQKGKGMFADTLYEAIVGNWERKKPVWVMLMINSLTEADIRTRGIPVLDLHLARKAEKMGKNVGAVEKVNEQCQPLNGLNMSQVIFALNHTLMMQENLRRGKLGVAYTTDNLIEQYNCGDINAITFDQDSVQVPKMMNDSAKNNHTETNDGKDQDVLAEDIDAYFKNELIYHRNERMAKRVNDLLKENPDQSFFFAFGAGHFLGNGSVIDFLKRYGYEIENVRSDRTQRNKLRKNHAKTHSRRKQRRSKSRKRNEDSARRKKHSRTERVRGHWKPPTSHKSTDNFSPRKSRSKSSEVDSSLLDKTEIRVINRYPTVFPPRFYNLWTNSGSKKQTSNTHLKSSWKLNVKDELNSNSRKPTIDKTRNDLTRFENSQIHSSSNVKARSGSKSFFIPENPSRISTLALSILIYHLIKFAFL